jgi:hypothetical protein
MGCFDERTILYVAHWNEKTNERLSNLWGPNSSVSLFDDNEKHRRALPNIINQSYLFSYSSMERAIDAIIHGGHCSNHCLRLRFAHPEVDFESEANAPDDWVPVPLYPVR